MGLSSHFRRALEEYLGWRLKNRKDGKWGHLKKKEQEQVNRRKGPYYQRNYLSWGGYPPAQAGKQLQRGNLVLCPAERVMQQLIHIQVVFQETHAHSWGRTVSMHSWRAYNEHTSQVQKMVEKCCRGHFWVVSISRNLRAAGSLFLWFSTNRDWGFNEMWNGIDPAVLVIT